MRITAAAPGIVLYKFTFPQRADSLVNTLRSSLDHYRYHGKRNSVFCKHITDKGFQFTSKIYFDSFFLSSSCTNVFILIYI